MSIDSTCYTILRQDETIKTNARVVLVVIIIMLVRVVRLLGTNCRQYDSRNNE